MTYIINDYIIHVHIMTKNGHIWNDLCVVLLHHPNCTTVTQMSNCTIAAYHVSVLVNMNRVGSCGVLDRGGSIIYIFLINPNSNCCVAVWLTNGHLWHVLFWGILF